ncbi:MAG: ABC transporter permease [Thermoleophilia bacterium]|nr:ABC transporter permease [Thermoleophilia bacterium]
MRAPRSVLVARNEMVTTLARRSFWVMALLFPAIIIAFSLGSQLIVQRTTGNSGLPEPGTPQSTAPVGYVDQAGLLVEQPRGLPAGFLLSFPDEVQAGEALAAGRIARYYLLPPGALETGGIVRVETDFRPLSSMDVDSLMRYAVAFNLFQNQDRALAYVEPSRTVQLRALAGEESSSEPIPDQGPLGFLVPFAVVFIMFFVITTTGGFMLQSVAREKENRTAEVLLVSIRPRELMLGKLLGLTVVALVQLAFWVGATTLALGRAREIFGAVLHVQIGPASFVWALFYFLLGYLLYASALGALGALAPGSREAGQFTMVVLLPLLAPLMLNAALAEAPNGTASIIMSLFPLTAPVAMVARLAVVPVPWWQALVGLAGLAATAYLLVMLSARFFRADTLLSGAGLSWARLRGAVRRVPT